MSQWSAEEFDDIFSNIRKELYKTDFFEMMRIENVEMFLHLLADELEEADDMDLLSDILHSATLKYNNWEVDNTIESLSEKGLIRMVVNEEGRLAYEATEEGILVNDQIQGKEIQTNYIMDINYSHDLYRVTGIDDGIRFVDHGNNYEFLVMSAGKQHDGEKMVQFYHTIFEDYHSDGPNGSYKLVDETELFEMLNTNYNQF
jgi:hypothetical protein